MARVTVEGGDERNRTSKSCVQSRRYPIYLHPQIRSGAGSAPYDNESPIVQVPDIPGTKLRLRSGLSRFTAGCVTTTQARSRAAGRNRTPNGTVQRGQFTISLLPHGPGTGNRTPILCLEGRNLTIRPFPDRYRSQESNLNLGRMRPDSLQGYPGVVRAAGFEPAVSSVQAR